ncbi:MAG: DUF2550 domain-containing protein [Propionibacteriaceae bacterium]|jgi:hypothetical protein|nr:DUF2550 domain-containing protein [Propionibacteriaceae bacterium]
MDWLLPLTEIIAVTIAVIVAVPILWLFGRRRWLGHRGGLFDCCLRLSTATPGTGWVLGVARYNGERLEWFRTFSVSMRPRKVFDRSTVEAGRRREPDSQEAALLMHDQRIIELCRVDGRAWELAMSTDSMTGLLSWLDAAPPVEAPGL